MTTITHKTPGSKKTLELILSEENVLVTLLHNGKPIASVVFFQHPGDAPLIVVPNDLLQSNRDFYKRCENTAIQLIPRVINQTQ